MTSVLILVVVPNPRILKAWPVGCNCTDGIVGVNTPGMWLMIWSTEISGMAWTSSRERTVVLTGMSSRSLPRPAVTVMTDTMGGSSAKTVADSSIAVPTKTSKAQRLKGAKPLDERRAREVHTASDRQSDISKKPTRIYAKTTHGCVVARWHDGSSVQIYSGVTMYEAVGYAVRFAVWIRRWEVPWGWLATRQKVSWVPEKRGKASA